MINCKIAYIIKWKLFKSFPEIFFFVLYTFLDCGTLCTTSRTPVEKNTFATHIKDYARKKPKLYLWGAIYSEEKHIVCFKMFWKKKSITQLQRKNASLKKFSIYDWNLPYDGGFLKIPVNIGQDLKKKPYGEHSPIRPRSLVQEIGFNLTTNQLTIYHGMESSP